MRRISVSLVAILIGLGVGLCGCGPDWHQITSDEGRYRTEILEPVKFSDDELQFAIGRITVHGAMFAVEPATPEIPFWRHPPLLSIRYADISDVDPWNRGALRDEFAAFHA